MRVSTQEQLKNAGSILWQEEQVAFLKQYGVAVERVEIYAGAESAAGNKFRPAFARLLNDVERGEVGLVVVADVDRNARNDSDSEALYNALEAVGGIVAERGQLYDPRDHSHRLMLRIRSAIAEYDNDNRSLKVNTGRAILARDLKYARSLPTGLLWADPSSDAYVTAVGNAGLEDWLDEDLVRRHKPEVTRGDRTLRILPYPDAEVHAACQLTLEWLLETRSLNKVMQRIASDPRWPRPKKFPLVRSYVVRLNTTDAEIPPVIWKDVVDVPSGREESGRARIFNWALTPALFGIYSFNSGALADLLPDTIPSRVWVTDAFPAFEPSDRYDRVNQILRTRQRFDRIGFPEGPRSHAIPHVVCAEPLKDGKPCGRMLSVIYPSAGAAYSELGHFYKAGGCGQRGHGYKLRQTADEAVIKAVLRCFTTDVLKRELDLLARREGASAEQAKRLEGQVEELRAKAEWAVERAYRCNATDNTKGEAKWIRRHEEWTKEAEGKSAQVRHLQHSTASEAEITDSEYQRILALATDLPELIRRSKAHDDLLATLMSEIISVVRARRVGWATYQLEIEFHSGAVVREIFWTRPTLAPQPLVLFAKTKLGKWADPCSRHDWHSEQEALAVAERIAVELNTILGDAWRTEWKPQRVFSAVLSNSDRPGRLEDARPVSIFCQNNELEEEAVLQQLLAGRLGEAILRDDEFWIDPGLEDVHRCFPEVARRYVAEQLKVAHDDIALVTELAERLVKRHDTLWHALRKANESLGNDGCGRAYSTLAACRRVMKL